MKIGSGSGASLARDHASMLKQSKREHELGFAEERVGISRVKRGVRVESGTSVCRSREGGRPCCRRSSPIEGVVAVSGRTGDAMGCVSGEGRQ
ncbi:uncharacterized protein A4U43_C03F25270 [Asparagus officinalis]|uniref:Uncharacterized protein n=1 Tax=Asparagus officinalis TaxID=4686 RepID=A0A5P1FHV0_ASPOF|nr:uncharacterized protein A4U43_C03F25270 [Asparagus officinalis]